MLSYLRNYKFKNYKIKLIIYVVILTIIGILVIGSANQDYQSKQILGFVIGIVLSCAFIALREIFDVRIKNETDIEKEFEYPILGIIPMIGMQNSGQESYYYRNSYYRYGKGGYYYGNRKQSGNTEK